jgi:hypothetical protein
LFVFYIAALKYTSGYDQTAVSFSFAILKFVVARISRLLIEKIDNPQFIQGACIFTFICSNVLSGILFIHVDLVVTFVILVTVDLLMNVYHMLTILLEVTRRQRTLLERQAQTLEVKSRGTMRSMVVVDAATCVCDCHSRRGEGRRATEGGGEARKGDEGGEMTAHARRQTVQVSIDGETFSTDGFTFLAAEYTGTLFLGELAEIICPLGMTLGSLCVYYLPNCYRSHVRYMNDVTEDAFLLGMTYALLDVFIQALTLGVVVIFLDRAFGISVLSVGFSILDRHKYTYAMLCIGLTGFFYSVYAEQSGVDSSFQFKWFEQNGESAWQLQRFHKPC